MDDKNVFEELATNLNSNERQALLDKIQTIKEISTEPLKSENDRIDSIDFKREYNRLNIFQKFFIFFKQLFTGKKPVQLVENLIIKRYVEKVQHQAAGLVNFSIKKFLAGLANELNTLNNYVSKIKAPFMNALESDRKNFFAFYVSIELAWLQEELIEKLDPYNIYEESKLVEASEVKDEMFKRFQSVLMDISDADKSKVSHNAFSLHYLYKLCFFNFDEIIARFNEPSMGGIGSLVFQSGLKDLSRLLDLLQSSAYPPPPSAIEAVIVFNNQGILKDKDIDSDAIIKSAVNRVEEAYSAIRKFNKKVPLLGIVKAATRNLNYTPKIIKGGDDWFLLFKNYWEEKIAESYKFFFGDIKKKTFMINSKEFLKLEQYPTVAYYNNESMGQNFTFQFPLSLALILGFYERLFLKALHKSLNILLLQGGFYKQENRAEFTDAYNFMTSLKEKFETFQASLSPAGDLGFRIERTQAEIMKGNLQQKHLEVVIKEIDKAAKLIIDATLKNLNLFELIINGVLFSKSGSKYDSISNLKQIGGKSNSELLTAWKICLSIIRKMNTLLLEITTLEIKGAV